MNKHLYFIIIFISLFSFATHASPCSPEELSESLSELGFDDDIETNGELFEQLSDKYGESLPDLLKEKHPFLSENPNKNIDAETIDWVQEIIWSSTHKYARYFFVPGTHYDNSAWSYLLGHMIQGFSEKKRRLIATFPNEEMKSQFKNIILDDEQLKGYISENYPEATNHAVEKLIVDIRKYFIEYDNIKVGFSGLDEHNKVVIQLSGHGMPSNPNIVVGDNSINAQQVVQQLKSLELPNDATVKMNVCFAACQNIPIMLPENIALDMFFKGNLKQMAEGDNPSLMSLLSEQLSIQMPNFNGEVQGYLGEVLSSKMDEVWSKTHGFQINSHAVRILTLDGYLLLRQKDSRITISPNQL